MLPRIEMDHFSAPVCPSKLACCDLWGPIHSPRYSDSVNTCQLRLCYPRTRAWSMPFLAAGSAKSTLWPSCLSFPMPSRPVRLLGRVAPPGHMLHNPRPKRAVSIPSRVTRAVFIPWLCAFSNAGLSVLTPRGRVAVAGCYQNSAILCVWDGTTAGGVREKWSRVTWPRGWVKG